MSEENQMHLVTCHIEVGGDKGTVVVRGSDRPVTWPEVLVLKALHGEDGVHTFEVVDAVARPRPSEEKRRLLSIYGSAVNEIYPGASPSFEWTLPGVTFTPPAVEPEASENEGTDDSAGGPAAEDGDVDNSAPAAVKKVRRVAAGVEVE